MHFIEEWLTFTAIKQKKKPKLNSEAQWTQQTEKKL